MFKAFASMAFDIINLLTLLKKLFERNMCPLFQTFFIHDNRISRCVLSEMLLYPAHLTIVMVLNKVE